MRLRTWLGVVALALVAAPAGARPRFAPTAAPPASANGIWQWRASQGRFSGRLVLVQDGAVVRGAILDSNTGVRGELDGRMEGRRLTFHRRFTDGGRVRDQEFTVTLADGGAQMQGHFIERGVRGGFDFSATRVFPAPGPVPPPPVLNDRPLAPTPPAMFAPAPATTATPTPIDADALHQLLQAIDHESFTDARLSVLAQAAGFRYFTVEQVGRILPFFTFEDAKLKVLELLRPRLVDPQNGFELDAQFFSSSAKARARQILAPR